MTPMWRALLTAWLTMTVAHLAGCGGRALSLVPLGEAEPPTQPYTAQLTVDGAARTALVYPPTARAVAPPLLLAFHGFTGNADGMASMTRFHERWPEALVVYPQGLDVVKPSINFWAPGWPDYPGKYDDRDVHFIDALLDQLIAIHHVDPTRVYATGFSNGATFTYLLYTQRPTRFAAFAGASGPATFLEQAAVPRPLLTINGDGDVYVPPALAATMRAEWLRANRCDPDTLPWTQDAAYTLYPPADGGQPLVWRQHASGHTWIPGATDAMVAFFREH